LRHSCQLKTARSSGATQHGLSNLSKTPRRPDEIITPLLSLQVGVSRNLKCNPEVIVAQF